MENDEVKPLQDINIQCHNVMEARRSDIIIAGEKKNKCINMGISIPGDSRVRENEFKK